MFGGEKVNTIPAVRHGAGRNICCGTVLLSVDLLFYRE